MLITNDRQMIFSNNLRRAWLTRRRFRLGTLFKAAHSAANGNPAIPNRHFKLVSTVNFLMFFAQDVT